MYPEQCAAAVVIGDPLHAAPVLTGFHTSGTMRYMRHPSPIYIYIYTYMIYIYVCVAVEVSVVTNG